MDATAIRAGLKPASKHLVALGSLGQSRICRDAASIEKSIVEHGVHAGCSIGQRIGYCSQDIKTREAEIYDSNSLDHVLLGTWAFARPSNGLNIVDDENMEARWILEGAPSKVVGIVWLPRASFDQPDRFVGCA